MYDLKVYEDGREKETIRGLSLSQASVVQSVLDRHGIKHTVKRLTPRALDLRPCGHKWESTLMNSLTGKMSCAECASQ